MPARTVLIVEDSVEEFLLLQFACQAVNVSFRLQHVDSADLALAYLHGSQNFDDKERFPRPALIILDLNMAGRSGFEVLEAVARAQPADQVPVLVFTSSMQDRDRLRALDLGAKQFVVKPVDYQRLKDFVRGVDRLLGLEANHSNPSAKVRPSGDNSPP